MKQINWLHISDLHIGVERQDVLLPKIKHEFMKDIEQMLKKIGTLDIVFFTGDITQSGKKEEYNQASSFIYELWDIFKRSGSNPILICTPGNHDLVRPDKSKATVKVIRDYHKDEESRKLFWDNIENGNEYIDLLENCFFNYVDWYDNISIPKPTNIIKGLLPGDYSALIEFNEITLGIISLNSSFLQLSEGDYLRCIEIGQKQILKCTKNDIYSWLKESDFAILATHHSKDWFSQQSLQNYNSDIYSNNTFHNHFCGHLHEASSIASGFIGSQQRRQQVAPSLFGLEKYNDSTKRLHGYFMGSYSFNGDYLSELFWPRKLIKKYNGDLKLGPDQGFDLDSDNCCITVTNDCAIHNRKKKEILIENNIDKVESPIQLLHENILNTEAPDSEIELLNAIPKIVLKDALQHKYVRTEEQEFFVDFLQKYNYVWIETEWGLDDEGFMSSSFEKMKYDKNRIFILNCEDISNNSEFIESFQNQFQISIQKFCILLNKLEHPILLINQLNHSIYQTTNNQIRFTETIRSIIDYCPKLYIVITTSPVKKNTVIENIIKLSPLDLPQIRNYVLNYAFAGKEYDKPIILEKLYTLTSGIPKHLDQILDGLKFASIEEIFEAELEKPLINSDLQTIPKMLIQSINDLANSKDIYRNRSFEMLKFLTILSFGEILKTLKKINSREPFYPQNASELEKLSLIESITKPTLITRLSGSTNDFQEIKLLRAPRQVRDYINSILSDNEKIEIVKKTCDVYFGAKWREGILKNINKPAIKEANEYLNFENYQIISVYLLKHAILQNNISEIERAANICISLCKKLYESNDFKDCLALSEDIYYIIKSTNLLNQKAEITKAYGETLRMLGGLDEVDKVIKLLNESLELGEHYFTKFQKASIYIDIAYAYENKGDKSRVVEYSKKIKEYSNKDDSNYLTGEVLILENTLSGAISLQKLKSIESKARKLGFTILANNISLSLTKHDTPSLIDKKKYLNKVLQTDDEYNKVRAIINKGILLVENKIIDEFDNEFLLLLSLSYTYLYFQRLQNLFNKCHRVLWFYLKEKNRYSELLNLYRHSSFNWRIYGENVLDENYLNQLMEQQLEISKIDKTVESIFNINYYERRSKEIQIFNNI